MGETFARACLLLDCSSLVIDLNTICIRAGKENSIAKELAKPIPMLMTFGSAVRSLFLSDLLICTYLSIRFVCLRSLYL